MTVGGYEEHFGYDDLNRVKSVRNAVVGLPVKEYCYDAIGNITYKSDVGLADYTYDPNHPHAVQTAGGNTYAYDVNGNQVSGAGRELAWFRVVIPAMRWMHRLA
ncbi:hypothetical protein D8Y20_12455 [Mariprofundus sp. EBB-1]|nr:hypothetical protein D8Y20_12455 [Mariprofundus sp. EBB-1]